MNDVTAEITRLKSMLRWPEMAIKRDAIERRLYALEKEVPFANPFNEVDECLFKIWRSQIETKVDSTFFDAV